jgi:hypothetical protein
MLTGVVFFGGVQIKGHNCGKSGKVQNQKLRLPFMVCALVNKFQIISLKGFYSTYNKYKSSSPRPVKLSVFI